MSLPMRVRFVYVVAIDDGYSRHRQAGQGALYPGETRPF